jgi:hypothetical protein
MANEELPIRRRRHWVRPYVRVRHRRPENVRGHIRPKE